MSKKKRSTKRKRKPDKGKNRRWRRVRMLVLVAVAGAGAWVLWPFWQLSQQFGVFSIEAPSRIYGRSRVLSTGQLLRPGQLEQELSELGYRSAGSGVPVPGQYSISGDTLTVYLRSFPGVDGPAGGGILEVEFGREWLRGLNWRGRSVRRAHLEPPLIATLYGPERQERRPVALDGLPEDLIEAVLAAEDSGFFHHPGFSISGIARAAWTNLTTDSGLQGGSTLTQQLVKNLYLTHERTWVRKAQEAVLAVMLEVRYEKREILEAYLNEIYWGQSEGVNLMGVGAASRAYFSKEPAHLTLAESATLAGMIKAPNNYTPVRKPERARDRRDWVLGRMHELGWIDDSELERTRALPVVSVPQEAVVRRAPYFVDRAIREVEERYGIDVAAEPGHVVLTTLDWRDQKKAEDAVEWGLDALEAGWEEASATGELQGALVSVDPNSGEILAWVGGREYRASQFDRASQAARQVGSAFKPVVYAAALSAGMVTPATLLEDAPLTVKAAGLTWEPQNDDREYHGWVTVRQAVERSLNVPTARVALEVGLDRVLGMARSLGVTGNLQPFPALALGAFEVTPEDMAVVYASIAGGGVRRQIHAVRAVLDPGGNVQTGESLASPERVLSPQVAYLLTSILQGVVERGTASIVRQQGLDDPLAGKTGTTNGRRDSWFGGFSPGRATMVWVGYDDNRETHLSGSRAALPIWGRFVWGVRPAGGYPNFMRPNGIETATIDPLSGLRATVSCPETQREVFLQNDAPYQHCYLHGRNWDRTSSRMLEPPGRLPSGEVVEAEKKRPWWKRMFSRKKNRDRDDGR